MNTTPTTGDRTWAVISHLSALTLGIGIVLPIVAWSDQRRKSNYGSFQSLQALGYQCLGYTVWVLLSALLAVLFAITVLLGLDPNRANSQAAIRVSAGIFTALMLGLMGIYLILPVVAAAACALGKDFRYPWMGNRLARYLAYDPHRSEPSVWLDDEHEFRWVAAMGHFSILVIIWGMLAPFTSWILFDKRNPFLRFQSIQTFVYQLAATILFFTGGFVYAVGLILFPVLLWSGLSSGFESPSAAGLIIFIVLSLIAVGILLLVPVLHIQGQWAGYRILKGYDYRYPLVGRLVDRWISNRSIPKENST